MATDEEIIEDEKDSKRFFQWGLFLTSLWVLIVWAIVYNKPILGLDANAIGDFLAGAVAPVAFLWFVLAYLIQSEELKYQRRELKRTTKTLRGQEKELNKHTKQLTEQSKLTQKDIKLRLQEATPRLAFQEIRTKQLSTETYETKIYFYNNGGNALGIKSSSPLDSVDLSILNEHHMYANHQKTGEFVYIRVQYKKDDSNFPVEFTYLDAFGKRYRHHCPFYPVEQEWPQFFEKPVEIKEPEEE
jgi:hypothetical protein